jgi:DNA-directed RNA polymerase subunit RPC12/RpoP
LQIPTPKPSTCDLTYIPGINGWAEFLSSIGLEQAFNTYTDIHHRRLLPEISIHIPYICAQCGTDWSVTWHEVSSNIDLDKDDKILCDRCRKTSQKKILKQDHSNRLRQAFMKALQQEKELDAKFQAIKQLSPNKPLPTKHKNHQKTNSSKHSNPIDTFTSTLAALPTNEQIELFQKHFLSNMFQFNVANQAAALAAKTTQQQQALAASLPAMAASLMRQANPAQYLLDMIPQATKQHHRHSK